MHHTTRDPSSTSIGSLLPLHQPRSIRYKIDQVWSIKGVKVADGEGNNIDYQKRTHVTFVVWKPTLESAIKEPK